ncbi:MAG: hypothetical protein IJT73_08835 [Selenomonadaceae bacterium]|nr:hypothetical protein [Selenomonadaceae bacterium]
MKKNLILLVGIIIISVASICNASWWSELNEREQVTCNGCGGSGTCSYCGGSGVVEGDYNWETENYDEETCNICDGSGTCNICGGAGFYYQ